MKIFLVLISFFQITILLSQEALFVSARNGLIVRNQPNKNAKRIGKLEYAQKIITFQGSGTFEEVTDNGKLIKGEWYYVVTNNVDGYVFNKFLTTKKLKKKINYYEFKPKSIPEFSLTNISIASAHVLDSLKVIDGYYTPKDGKIVAPDTQKDWGNRLYLLNKKNEILFKSFGVGDVYTFDPHFYKNDSTNKIIIVCQLGYEYCFGGEAFLYEDGNISAIGTLDIENDDEGKCLTDIIKIQEIADELIFSFNSDYLLLEPGLEDILIKNTGVIYNYSNQKLTLKK